MAACMSMLEEFMHNRKTIREELTIAARGA